MGDAGKGMMSVLRQLDARLAALEAGLADRPQAASEVRAIRALLADDDALWIGTVEAKRLLGVGSVNTIKAWARLGWLRSQRAPNGRLKVHLHDVLREREQRKAILGFGDDDELPHDTLRRVREQLRDRHERARTDAELAAAGLTPEPVAQPM
jgi:hypothetical protein